MRFVLFVHSLVSDWNHGNAHFLRGIVRELQALGHEVRVYEPDDGWSRRHLIAEHGLPALDAFSLRFPGLTSLTYRLGSLDLDRMLDGADAVIVHEWNDPALVAALGRHRRRGGRALLLFHDTHHRSISDRAALEALDLDGYDGVLAFGEVLREIYLARGWSDRVWTWHEAADVALFTPLPDRPKRGDVIWIGNWGDGERTAELETYLMAPVRALGLSGRVHGVRYPQEAVDALGQACLDYQGWLANADVPEAFAAHRLTVHVPRRPYVEALPGIPTIRVFEALACGIPLISAPWDDRERLFEIGRDFLMASDGEAMKEAMRFLLNDADAARELARNGRAIVLARHTCRHRVRELLAICASLGSEVAMPEVA